MAKRATTEQTHPTICIQEIHTTWTKKSRGGSGAVARNRVPEELPLPEVVNVADSPTVLYHKQWYKEQGDLFALCKTDFEVSKTIPFLIQGVRIVAVENSLRAYWEYHNTMGAPPRPVKPKVTFMLETNQWGRILYNGRHSPDDRWDESEWSYNRWVFNIGIFSKPVLDVFVSTKPAQIYSQMANLW